MHAKACDPKSSVSGWMLHRRFKYASALQAHCCVNRYFPTRAASKAMRRTMQHLKRFSSSFIRASRPAKLLYRPKVGHIRFLYFFFGKVSVYTLALLRGTWPPVAPHAATLWAQRQKSTRRHAGLAREREWQALLHRLHSGPWLAGPCPFLSNNLLLLARSLKFLNSWISNANIYLTIYLI